jgi:hypothetical protein
MAGSPKNSYWRSSLITVGVALKEMEAGHGARE